MEKGCGKSGKRTFGVSFDKGLKATGKGRSLEERKRRLKQLKQQTRCSECGEKGHWHRDLECNKNKDIKPAGSVAFMQIYDYDDSEEDSDEYNVDDHTVVSNDRVGKRKAASSNPARPFKREAYMTETSLDSLDDECADLFGSITLGEFTSSKELDMFTSDIKDHCPVTIKRNYDDLIVGNLEGESQTLSSEATSTLMSQDIHDWSGRTLTEDQQRCRNDAPVKLQRLAPRRLKADRHEEGLVPAAKLASQMKGTKSADEVFKFGPYMDLMYSTVAHSGESKHEDWIQVLMGRSREGRGKYQVKFLEYLVQLCKYDDRWELFEQP